MEAKERKQGSSEQKREEGGQVEFLYVNGWLYKQNDSKLARIANYQAQIISDKLRIGEGGIQDRTLVLKINLGAAQTLLSVTSGEFFSEKLPRRILEAAGPTAITCRSSKDLRHAIQQFSTGPSEHKMVTGDIGFTGDGCYLAKGMLITPSGITLNPQTEIDLNTGQARNLKFESPDESTLKRLGEHILTDFLALKPHAVMCPLIGHICIAPFSSRIYEITGKNKPVLHLIGPSGAGKTFLGILAMAFYGSFYDGVVSWSSTPNAIEAAGYLFKDSLFLVNDFKSSCTDQRAATRILQNYADGSGRSRMRPDSRVQNPSYIRGLLLSTGEDCLRGIKSVLARSILLRVPPEKNLQLGEKCRNSKAAYPMFLPGLIQSVILDANWAISWAILSAEKQPNTITAFSRTASGRVPTGL
jgi:hypothetical protein